METPCPPPFYKRGHRLLRLLPTPPSRDNTRGSKVVRSRGTVARLDPLGAADRLCLRGRSCVALQLSVGGVRREVQCSHIHRAESGNSFPSWREAAPERSARCVHRRRVARAPGIRPAAGPADPKARRGARSVRRSPSAPGRKYSIRPSRVLPLDAGSSHVRGFRPARLASLAKLLSSTGRGTVRHIMPGRVGILPRTAAMAGRRRAIGRTRDPSNGPRSG